jgi:hypothetical protein
MGILKESILDPIHSERCRDMFVDDDTIRKDVVDYIYKTFKDWESTLKQPLKVKSIYMVGSLFGYMYSSDTDVDVHVTLDCTDDELKEIKKSRPALVNIPNTEHPIEITLKNADEKFDCDESVYDVLNRKFIKLVPKQDISEVPDAYVGKITEFYLNAIDIGIGDADRDIRDLDTIEQKHRDGRLTDERYKKAITDKRDELTIDLDGISLLFDMMRALRSATMNHGDAPLSISIEIGKMPDDPHYQVNEMIYKTFAKYGYRERLIAKQNELRKVIEKLDGMFTSDVSKPNDEEESTREDPDGKLNESYSDGELRKILVESGFESTDSNLAVLKDGLESGRLVIAGGHDPLDEDIVSRTEDYVNHKIYKASGKPSMAGWAGLGWLFAGPGGAVIAASMANAKGDEMDYKEADMQALVRSDDEAQDLISEIKDEVNKPKVEIDKAKLRDLKRRFSKRVREIEANAKREDRESNAVPKISLKAESMDSASIGAILLNNGYEASNRNIELIRSGKYSLVEAAEGE